MSQTTPRFDMQKKPHPCRWYWKPVIWALCYLNYRKHRTVIRKSGMEGIRPPYILLGNHNAFFDMSVSAMATFPHFANYVVAIDGFIGREWLLRAIGCVCKRKFTTDSTLVRHIRYLLQKKCIVGIYPEARYSLCGTTAVLPSALGKLCKSVGVPVVMLLCHGHHINHPFWNTRRERGVRPTEAEMFTVFTPQELAALSVDEINRRLVEVFQYDDFRWQKEKGIRVSSPDRADGLEKVLYQCPNCRTEFAMSHDGTGIVCRHCGKRWEMTETGELKADDGKTEFSHIPDWYEWQRANVRREVTEGRYTSGTLAVSVESLPNAKKFIPLGKGTMVHDMNGFHVSVTDADGQVHQMEKPVASLYSCHVEYRYLFTHGDCVDLNTQDDTWYIYPEGDNFAVTKMALATEELYQYSKRMQGKSLPPGLA